MVTAFKRFTVVAQGPGNLLFVRILSNIDNDEGLGLRITEIFDARHNALRNRLHHVRLRAGKSTSGNSTGAGAAPLLPLRRRRTDHDLMMT